MAITAEEVRRIAKLARLRLTVEEAAVYQSQFARILELMAELAPLDISATEVTAAIAGPSHALREDEPRPFPEPERLLAIAPEREGGYYKVKKVLA